ncbi:MAG: hypothetical protein AB7P76_04910 [Candidatus Melainabacteria bacterium]
MSTRCPVCNGRTVKTETGTRCMNSSCTGASESVATLERKAICHCGVVMDYRGLNSYGAPKFVCPECKSSVVL